MTEQASIENSLYMMFCNIYVPRMAVAKTVMICDDERDLLEIYQRTLEPKYKVVTVCSGKECIKKFVEEHGSGKKIDVLLLDYRLGDMLGDEVACKIRELNGTKVVLISAYELDEDMLHDLRQRGCIVLAIKKPLSLKYLVAQIDAL